MKTLSQALTVTMALALGLLFLPAPATAAEAATADSPRIAIPDVPVARGPLLPALYVGLAGLNVFDAVSTLNGVRRGAVESNGVMAPIAANAPALWLVKGSVTAGSIVVAERLWRSHRRGQAIGLLVVTNSMMAVVAARNASVLRHQP